MSDALIGTLCSIAVALATGLIWMGALAQRVKTLEAARKDPDPLVATLQTQMRACHARLKDLEEDRREHSRLLSTMEGVVQGLKESIDGLREDMRDLLKKWNG
jgi:uncharacterized coiled-coil protein SlyX